MHLPLVWGETMLNIPTGSEDPGSDRAADRGPVLAASQKRWEKAESPGNGGGTTREHYEKCLKNAWKMMKKDGK